MQRNAIANSALHHALAERGWRTVRVEGGVATMESPGAPNDEQAWIEAYDDAREAEPEEPQQPTI